MDDLKDLETPADHTVLELIRSKVGFRLDTPQTFLTPSFDRVLATQAQLDVLYLSNVLTQLKLESMSACHMTATENVFPFEMCNNKLS